MFGVIGGSGFEKFDEFETLNLMDRETPFGLASSGFKKVRVNGKEFLFLSRHGDYHEHLPSEVNYRANIYAMKKNGVKAILSFSAVGSLNKDCAPGDLVVPNQYIDRTKGVRKHTFLGEGLIGHVSLAHPTCDQMEKAVQKITPQLNFKTHYNKTYICIEGPYFSTKAESLSYRQMGADIIGMTNFPEFALAREAGIAYLPLSFVTDYDCWDDSIPHVTVEEVIKVMKGNNTKAFGLLKEILNSGEIYSQSKAFDGGLRSGLFMPREAIPADKKAWMEVLLS
ncbi:MAG: MTAP family purine nucleoside phosphorylase [Bdellovibrionia bacterium]